MLELQVGSLKRNLKDYEKNAKVAVASASLTAMDGTVYKFNCDMNVTLLNPNEKAVGKEDWEIGKHYFRVKTAEAIEEAQKLADGENH